MRQQADPGSQVCPGTLPVETSPADGSTSDAAIASRVDFPAPFGPTSATMLPASHWNDTRLRAHRRPKVRDTSANVSEVKSMDSDAR